MDSEAKAARKAEREAEKAERREEKKKRREEDRALRKDYWPTLRFTFGVIWKTGRSVLLAKLLSMSLNRAAWTLYSTYFLAYIFDRMEKGEADVALTFGLLGGIALLLGTVTLFTAWHQKYLLRRFEDELTWEVDRRIYEKAAKADLECFENPEFYDKYSKAMKNSVKNVLNVLNAAAYQLAAIPMVVIALSFILSREPLILIFALLASIFPLLFGDACNRAWKRREDKLTPSVRRQNYMKRVAYLQEYAKDLRLSGIPALLFRRFGEAVEEGNRITMQSAGYLTWISYLRWTMRSVFGWVLPIAYIAVRAIGAHAFSVGVALALVNGVGALTAAIDASIDYFNDQGKAIRLLSNLRAFLNHEDRITAPAEGALQAQLRPGGSEIEFRGVTFTYPGKETPVLRNLSFRIRAGQTVAVVGPNGAGKTTIVKLLMRLYDPDEGQILLDGEDLRRYDPESLRKCFAVVFQDFKLFGLSLGENVLMRPLEGEEDRRTAERCLRLAGFGEKLARMPQGLDTLVTREFSEEGTNFSGGEGQEIAIARVFARPCAAVVLDEPTSALDPIAEGLMFENMARACEDKTVVFISHRLSSARTADHVLVIENGALAEQGTHAELMERGGAYAEMFRKQSERYRAGGEEATENG